ncbi:hypothetical protein IQ07DRAFT_10829 [Pyrenochaeta sp. DS3sAY3a]|nr:hypothetical protein IQ07DRAFT_10829 [Pyrenochaeta sp. DS3sAY3a]
MKDEGPEQCSDSISFPTFNYLLTQLESSPSSPLLSQRISRQEPKPTNPYPSIRPPPTSPLLIPPSSARHSSPLVYKRTSLSQNTHSTYRKPHVKRHARRQPNIHDDAAQPPPSPLGSPSPSDARNTRLIRPLHSHIVPVSSGKRGPAMKMRLR